MNISLHTQHLSAPSTVLNKALLEKIPANFTFNDGFKNKDVILFMGYDPNIEQVRKINKKALIGIIDPRPGSEKELQTADFWLANGVEMLNYFSATNPNAFIYPIYPPLDGEKEKARSSSNKKRLVLGYHGNKAHLELMQSNVCPALERLADKVHIELRVICNVSQLGKWDWKPKSSNVDIRHINWSEDAYVKHLADVDVGIVPNLISMNLLENQDIRELKLKKLAHDSDLCLRFKPTSNLGRILVFFQLGVPVVADMFPSSAECIRHGHNGLLASNPDSWYNALHLLWLNRSLRNDFAIRSLKLFQQHYHWDKINNDLLRYLSTFSPTSPPLTKRFKEKIRRFLT